MKKRILYILTTVILGLSMVGFAVPVAATDSTSTSTTTTTSSDGSTAALNARIAKYKDKLKVALSTAEQARIKLRCVGAQGTVKSLNSKVQLNSTARTQAYTELNTNLTALLVKLDAKGVDTTELKTEMSALTAKVTTYKTDLADYTQSLTDINAMDCASDATAFKAALENARTLRTSLNAEITDIHTYVTSTIKPTLAAIRAKLDDKTTTNTGTTN